MGKETRNIVIAGKGRITTKVGVAIIWSGGLIQHMRMIKEPKGNFYEDDTTDRESLTRKPNTIVDDQTLISPIKTIHIQEKEVSRKEVTSKHDAAAGENDIKNDSEENQYELCRSESTDSNGTNDIFQLEPPYLVPRPRYFPIPTLIVTVVSASNLEGNTALPRPVNPFVSMTLSGQSFKSSVKKNTKNPVWDTSQIHSDADKTKKYQEVDKRKFEYKF